MVDAQQTDAQEYGLDRDCMDPISSQVATSELLLRRRSQCLWMWTAGGIASLAGKIIARRLSRAGLMEGVSLDLLETSMCRENCQKMDVLNDAFLSRYSAKAVCRLASEEMENPLLHSENCP